MTNHYANKGYNNRRQFIGNQISLGRNQRPERFSKVASHRRQPKKLWQILYSMFF